MSVRTITKDGLTIKVKRMEDVDVDSSYLEQEGFEDRLAQYRRGDFGFIGVVVTVERGGIKMGCDSLWGIEDDSGEEYFESVEAACVANALTDARKNMQELVAFGRSLGWIK
jgi:hypothetical protein